MSQNLATPSSGESKSLVQFPFSRAKRGDEEQQEENALLLKMETMMHTKKQEMDNTIQEEDRLRIQELEMENQLKNNEYKEDNEDGKESLYKDTFSIMMTSKVYSKGWALGLITFVLQMTLVIMILVGQSGESKDSTLFDVPFKVSTEVRVGQFFTIILSSFTQRDVLTAIKYLIMFRTDGAGWRILLVDDDESIVSTNSSGELPPMRGMWFRRAVLPNLLKMVQGLLVLFTSLVVIVQSDDIIDLLKDFTALFFVSEIDNIVFYITEQRYFGNDLKQRSGRVKNVHVEDETVIVGDDACGCRGVSFRFVSLFILFATMVSTWGYFVQGQVSGRFFAEKYPFCLIKGKNEISKFGDGRCDGSIFNSIGCGFDGGDCLNFNLAYPNCDAGTDAYTIGDGNCTDVYNTPECLYDGGDCCPFDKKATEFNNGECNGGLYNTKACDYDGGECETFNLQYPDCPIEELSLQVDVTKPIILGDGVCDSGVYMTEDCGYEGNDCKECAAIIPNGTEALIGNGICNGGVYMADACNLDGGDCSECAKNIPPGTEHLIGNDICNGGLYFTEECGYESGDCDECIAKIPNDTANLIGNGICDGGLLMSESACNQDGGDCSECANIIPSGTEALVGDGFCNGGNFMTDACGNDGGDCAIGSCSAIPSSPMSTNAIVAADVNNDGFIDLIIGNYNQANQLLLNTGNATGDGTTTPFQTPINLPGGEMWTIAIVAADVNNDGLVDLIFGNWNQANQLLLNTGEDAIFGSAIDIPCSGTQTWSLAVADMDNDGHLDIVFGNRNQKNQLLMNLGDGISYKEPAGLGSSWLPDGN